MFGSYLLAKIGVRISPGLPTDVIVRRERNLKPRLLYYERKKCMSIHIRRVLIEALKPRETPIVELSQAICSVNGVEECDMVVTDVDVKTETIKLTVRGPNIEYDGIAKIMQEHGMSIKGVDEISVSKTKQPSTRPASP
jgi:hypothetical protein